MSEFTKLGGYLIQGQPEVVHDSALSGNGLEGSPLGLSEEFITGTMRPATQSALNLNIGHPENNNVAEAGATIGSNNTAANTGLAVGFGASAFNMSIAVGENTHASNRGIAVGNGVDANGIAAFGTHNAERNTGHGCIFVVGNGTDSANRSDAFKIYNDGRVEAPNFVTTNNVHLSALTGVSEANDLVHSNSGTWDGVSAKLDASAVNSAFIPLYGLGVSGIDNKPIFANFAMSANYAKFDENGTYLTSYLTAVPTGTMNETAFGYDASNNITAYNGSAFKAGDEFPQSATEAIETVTANSADWNGTTETISSNSGAWGGSALPISAGPGVKISLQNDTLVFENDETLLYSTSSPANTINLSEASTGFEKLRLELSSYQSREIVNYTEVKPNASYLTYFANALIPAATYPLQIAGIQFTANNAKDYTMTTGVRMCYKVNETYGDQYTTIATTNIRDVGFITKIWGINRIAGV